MPRHGRRRHERRPFSCLARYAAGLFLLTWLWTGPGEHLAAQSIDWRLPDDWTYDAELTDLHFIDASRGWVVGERGLVLRTEDGGASWNQISLFEERDDPNRKRIRCRLECVYFADANHGWIAGGYVHPGATSSSGVLFRTTDGGATWQHVRGAALPKISQVFFLNRREGYAIGEGNRLRPSGILQTSDGGRTWSASQNSKRSRWMSGSWTGNRLLVANLQGDVGVFQPNADRPDPLGEAVIEDGSNSVIRAIAMLDEQHGYAAGERGGWFETRNGGWSWHPSNSIPGLPESGLDYWTLAESQGNLWVAGSPGTRIFKLPAGSDRWQSATTPVPATITQLFFVDSQSGWAISLQGDILHTNDGGESWTIQRRGASGVALLQIGQDIDDFIPELFSRYCGGDDYIGGALRIQTRRDANLRSMNDVRLQQALNRVNGSFVLTRLAIGPETPSEQNQLIEYLVRQIRIFRPRVITIHSGHHLTTFDFRSLVQNAVVKAAEHDAYPEHRLGWDLNPWEVGKILVIDRADVSNLKIAPGHYMMGIAGLISDHAMPSRMLLGQMAIDDRPVSLTTIHASPRAAGPSSTLFGSIENTDGAIPVRRKRTSTGGNLVQMRQLASKRKSLNRFLEIAPTVVWTPALWNRELAQWVAPLEPATAGVWLYELARRCDAQGYSSLAAETHLMVTRRFRKHPLAPASFRWLYQYYASEERAQWAWSEKRNHDRRHQEAVGDGPLGARPVTSKNGDGIRITRWEVPDSVEDSDANASTGNPDGDFKPLFRRRFQQARAIMQSFAVLDPTAPDYGPFQFSRIGLNQKLDPLISTGEQLRQIALDENYSEALRQQAAAELAILEGRDESAFDSMITAVNATQRPWLDGQLNDPLWQAALAKSSTMPLVDARSDSQGDVLLACDDSFLYLAIRCKRRPGFSYTSDDSPRIRDGLPGDSDRVELVIDLDRDFNTHYWLCVDAAGQVAECLQNNLAWDPQWYVASSLAADDWTVEIAVPLDELSCESRSELRPWAVSASRFVRDDWVAGTRAGSVSAGLQHPESPRFRSGLLAARELSPMPVWPLSSFHRVQLNASAKGSDLKRLPPDP